MADHIPSTLSDLLNKIEARPMTRHEYHPALRATLKRLERTGWQVPKGLRHLERTLSDEAFEAEFDNVAF